MANSLGSLYIDIIARTATLEKDMDKVKQVLNQATTSTKQAGEAAQSAFKSFQLFNSFQGRGMTGISLDMFSFFALLQAVKKEVEYVIQNIDKIPGIPAETVSNVNEFKLNLQLARNYIDNIIASGLNGIAIAGKAIGAGLGYMLEGEDAMNESLKATLDSLDKLHALNDPAYYDKLRTAQLALSEAKKKSDVAEVSMAEKIIVLNRQAQAYFTFAKSNSIDSLVRTENQTKGIKDQTEAEKLHMEIQKTYDTNVRRYYADETKELFALMSQKDKMAELDRKIGEGMVAAGMMRPHEVGKGLAPFTDADMEKANKQFPQLLQWMNMYRAELTKIQTESMVWRDLTVSLSSELDNFLTSFTTGGKVKINDFLKSISDAIIQTFFKLAVINPLLNAMFGSSKGFAILPTLMGKADGGPARGLTLVGERGPELINLGSGSTVIPNHAGVMGGGGSGMTVYMDARGADESRIIQMERNLAYLHATFERRTLGIIVNSKNRRGATSAALA